MKRSFFSLGLVAVILILNAQVALAASTMFNSANLAPPIRERILYGEDKSPVFDALLHPEDNKGHMEEKYVKALKWNSGLALKPEDFPEIEEQDAYFRDKNQAKDGQSFAQLKMVVRVRFDAGDSVSPFEPAVKWLAVGAPYGPLPLPVGDDVFVGWFTEPNGGGEKVDSFSIAAQGDDNDGNKTLYAHWEPLKFYDVARSSVFYAPISWAVQKNITQGTTDDTFSPGALCTRKQILMFLWRYETQPEESNYNNSNAAIQWAKEQGIIFLSDTNYDINAPCSRLEAVSFIYRDFGSPSMENVNSDIFHDIAGLSAYDIAAINWAVEKHITNGTSNSTFSPDSTCTRAQIIKFLFSADKVK